MAKFYRQRKKQGDGEKGVRRSFSISPDTMKGLDKIRAAFHSRWPQSRYASLSAILEQVLASNLKRLDDPEEMAVEVEDFRRRYCIPSNHAVAAEDSSEKDQQS